MLRRIARRVRPRLLVVSAGYDFVAGDPIGDLGVAASAVRQIGRIAREIATEYCDGRALFVLEGGYDPATLATCVIETILGFEEGKDVDHADHAAIPGRQRAILGDLEDATTALAFNIRFANTRVSYHATQCFGRRRFALHT